MASIGIISVSDHIHLAMKEIESRINSFTYPVFVNARNDKPDLIASSVVIEYKEKYYLITASHVINEVKNSNSPFYIGLNGKFVALKGKFTRSINEDKDNFDIAFQYLEPSFISKNKISSVPESEILVGRSFKSFHLGFIHGYPCSKNKQYSALRGGYEFRSYAFTYAGKTDRNFNNWQHFNKSQEFHIPMNYGKSKDIHGSINIPPCPIGISGGGYWILPNSFNSNRVYLSGIAIEYYQKEKLVFSTKIEKVLEFVNKNT